MDEFLDSDDEPCESDCEIGEAESNDEEDNDSDDDTQDEPETVTNESHIDPNWVAKDGTEWLRVPPQKKVGGRAPKHSIIKGLTGITPYATSRINDEVTAFKLSLNDYTFSEMLEHTNQKGREKHGDAWKDVDATELDAFVGLMVLSAVFKANKEALESLWDEEMGRPIYRATMPLKRFKLIHSMLRFDNKAARSPVKGSGIKNVWFPWVARQSVLYAPHESITIDEQLYGYRGRVFCRVFMGSKPDKYGFRFDHACCSQTGFVLKSQLYLGKNGETKQTNVSETTVCNLVLNSGYEGRNVTVDNFYTSLSLARTLLKNGMTLVGTLRRNKRYIPPALLDLKKRVVGSSLYAYSGTETIVSYMPKKGKNVLLMSTLHTDLQANKPKPEMIEYYNSTKGAVDTLDRRIASYSVKRATRNWMVVVVSDMIDISLNNSFILHNEVFPGMYTTAKSGKRKFLQELGSKLVHAQIVRRTTLPRGEFAAMVVNNRKQKSNLSVEEPAATSSGTKRKSKDSAKEPAATSSATKRKSKAAVEDPPATSSGTNDRKRCGLCQGNDNKYNVKCAKCPNTICKQHTVTICTKCNE